MAIPKNMLQKGTAEPITAFLYEIKEKVPMKW